MAIIDAAMLQGWTNQPLTDFARQEEAERCCAAAVEWIAQSTGHVIEQASYVRYLNGDDACGSKRDTLYMPSGLRPVIHSGGDLVTATEDGVAVTIATGYSTTASVILENANQDLVCALRRNIGAWSTGVQNVAVTFKAGWTVTTVPADVQQLALEAALLMLRGASVAGKASESKGGAAVTWLRDLSPMAQATFSRLTVM